MTAQRWAQRAVPAVIEQRYVAEGWWDGDTLGEMVARSLAASPQATVSTWSRLREWRGTYADIDQEARQLVAFLQASGIEPGEVVAFQVPNWREAVVSFAGLAMGGYVLVPIVHIYGRKEVAFILNQCGAAAYISPSRFGHVDYSAIVDESIPTALRLHIVVGDNVEADVEPVPPVGSGSSSAANQRPTLSPTSSPGQRGADSPSPLTVDPEATSRSGPRHGAPFVRVGWAAVPQAQPATELPTGAATDVAVLAYTSGTTSEPKGVIHNHRTLLSELRHIAAWITPRKPNLMGSPVTHATGMLGAVLGPLKVGSDIHLIDRWDPGHALEVMLAAEIGGGTGASVFLAGLLDHPDFTPAHAANMGRVGLGGAPVPVALGERAERLGIAIIRAYGSTEHPSITGAQFDDPPEIRHRTDGRPLPGVEVRLIDLDGNEAELGQAGEIWSRGPELCLGYTDVSLNEAFDDAGWFRTGDVGRLDEHGCLTITDRVKDIIIRGGENISAAEVEGAIERVPGVAEVAVVAAPDERLGEHACAVIRLKPATAPMTLDDLVAHLQTSGIARQKWPEELRIVTDFPRTAAGKIRKVDLRAQLRNDASEATGEAPKD